MPETLPAFLEPRHLEIRDDARRFAEEVVRPGSSERDSSASFPEDVIAAAAKRGYLGLLVPKEYGGLGLGNMEQCLVFEELARADAATHVTISVHNSLATGPLVAYASEDLKQRYLPRLASGEMVGAYALTETQSGSDAAGMTTTATDAGDHYVLQGSKMWITTGIRADLMIVFAVTDRDAKKGRGISAFAVETDTEGLSCGKKENKLGLRASETVQVFFEGVKVPKQNLIGELNQGFKMALQLLNGGRIGIAVQAIGIAQAALDLVVAFFKERTLAGHPPRQEESFLLSEFATKVEAARLLAWQGARLRDQKRDHMREGSMAKLFASTTANEVCQRAVQLLGATGWRHAGQVERLLRDARVTELYEGTTEIQKLVIARTLLS